MPNAKSDHDISRSLIISILTLKMPITTAADDIHTVFLKIIEIFLQTDDQVIEDDSSGIHLITVSLVNNILL